MNFSFIEVASYNLTGRCPHCFNCSGFMLDDCRGNDCWEDNHGLDWSVQAERDFIG